MERSIMSRRVCHGRNLFLCSGLVDIFPKFPIFPTAFYPCESPLFFHLPSQDVEAWSNKEKIPVSFEIKTCFT